MHGLQECSVVLTRLWLERQDDELRTRTGRNPLGSASSARDSLIMGQTITTSREDPRQVLPADGVQAGDSGVVILLPLQDFTCTLCGMSASTWTWTKKHYATRHGNVLVRYSCGTCGKTSHLGQAIACYIPKCGTQIALRVLDDAALEGPSPPKWLRSSRRNRTPSEPTGEFIGSSEPTQLARRRPAASVAGDCP